MVVVKEVVDVAVVVVVLIMVEVVKVVVVVVVVVKMVVEVVMVVVQKQKYCLLRLFSHCIALFFSCQFRLLVF